MIGAILGLLGYSALQVVGYTAFLPQIQKSLEKNKGKANFWSVLFAPALAFDSVFNGRESLSVGNQKKAIEKIKKKQQKETERLQKRAQEKFKIFKNKKLNEKYGPEILNELENKMNDLLNDEKNLGKSEKDIFGDIDKWFETQYKQLLDNKVNLKKEANLGSSQVKTEQVKKPIEKDEKNLYEKIDDYFKLYKIVIKGDEISLANFKNKDKLNKIYDDYYKLAVNFDRTRNNIEEQFSGKENEQSRKELLKQATDAYNKSLVSFMLGKVDNVSRMKFINDNLSELQNEFNNNLVFGNNASFTIEDVIKERNLLEENSIKKINLDDKKIKKYFETIEHQNRINELTEKKNNNQISEKEKKELFDPYHIHSFEQATLKEINNTFGLKDYLNDIDKEKKFNYSDKEKNNIGKIYDTYHQLENIPLDDYVAREKCEKELKGIIKDLYNNGYFGDNNLQVVNDKGEIKDLNIKELSEKQKGKIKDLTQGEVKEMHYEKIYNHLVEKLDFNRIKNLETRSISGDVNGTNLEIVDFPINDKEQQIIDYLLLKKKTEKDYQSMSFANEEEYTNYKNNRNQLFEKEQKLYEAQIAPNVLKGLELISKNEKGKEFVSAYDDLEKSLVNFSLKYKEELEAKRYDNNRNYANLFESINEMKKIKSIQKVEIVDDKNRIDVAVNKYTIYKEKLKDLTLTTGQQRIVDCLNELYKDGVAPADVFDKRSLNALKRKGIIKEEDAGQRKYDMGIYNSCAIYSKPIYITVEKDKAIAVVSKTLNGRNIPVNKISKEYVSQETIELLKNGNKDLATVLENKPIEKEMIDINSNISR